MVGKVEIKVLDNSIDSTKYNYRKQNLQVNDVAPKAAVLIRFNLMHEFANDIGRT